MRLQATSLAFILSATALSLPAFAHDSNADKSPVYLDRPLSASAEDTCTPGFLWQGRGQPEHHIPAQA